MPWFHPTPIPGHGMEADIDCSGLDFPAKFAVVGDFDGDGQAEIAVAPEAPDSKGNDFWVMKFDTNIPGWHHLSPIPGHGMRADIDFSGLAYPAKFAVVGDFDGDGQAEIAVAPDAPASKGNDFWVMKFDRASGGWHHLSPIPGHGMGADIDCSVLDYSAKFAVVGDFASKGRAEIAVAPEARRSKGNDFWVMSFAEKSPELTSTFTGTATFRINDNRFPGPFIQNINLTLTFSKFRVSVRLNSFPMITVGPFSTPIGSNSIAITSVGGGSGRFDPASGDMFMPIKLHFDHSLPDIFVGDSTAQFNLTTGASSSPLGAFSQTGTPLNRNTGGIVLVGGSRFEDGFLGETDCFVQIAGTLSPLP